jgi:cyclophilin family peptidyl-prolyl cis-trans isomerase
VVPDFVVQFGIHTDSTKNTAWTGVKVPDEPVIKLNELGTISFARGGTQTRSTQLFINIKNNSPRLDELDYSGVKGFPVIAQVTEGMEVVEKFYGAYGNEPATKQGAIYAEGNAFLKANYPELDYITKAYIIK